MKRKHILSLLLSLLMLFSFTVSAFAESEATNEETSELQIDMDEGRRLWNEYIKQLEPYKDDETIFDTAFSYVAHYASETYSENLGRSKEEFENKSQYEKLLWLPWVLPARYCPKMSDPLKLSSWELLAIKDEQRKFKKIGENGEEIGKVYYDLMKWHFDYYVETRKIFNFVDTFGTEVKEPEGVNSEGESEEDVSESYNSQTIQLPSKAPTESVEEISVDISEEKGIWDGVIDYVKTHVITLVILLILCIATAVVVIYRKKKNIDNK